MTTVIEAEARVSDWRDDKRVLPLKEKRQSLREDLAATRADLTAKRQVLADGDAQLDALLAEQLLNGNKRSERYETLDQNLANVRVQIVALERKERALLMADKTITSEIGEAEGKAKAEAGERLWSTYREKVKALKDLIEEARKINDDLLDLDGQIKESGLGEIGSAKKLILLARHSIAWNAIAPLPIVAPVIHFDEWSTHVERVLGV